MIFYVPFMPFGFAGYTIGPIILISRDYCHDRGLIEHEKTHVAQWRRDGIKSIAALWNSQKRLSYEVEAYKKQLEFGANPLKLAEHLANRYGFDLTIADALDLLQS